MSDSIPAPHSHTAVMSFCHRSSPSAPKCSPPVPPFRRLCQKYHRPLVSRRYPKFLQDNSCHFPYRSHPATHYLPLTDLPMPPVSSRSSTATTRNLGSLRAHFH